MVMQKHEGVIKMTTETKPSKYGQRMRQLILAGYANRPVVRLLRREFPGCKCTPASVSSMRWFLRKEGHHVFTSHEAPKQRADYAAINSSARPMVQTIIELAVDAIYAGFDKEDASAWVRLNA
jgi:hypothetical protein